jgi:hypothetical protein
MRRCAVSAIARFVCADNATASSEVSACGFLVFPAKNLLAQNQGRVRRGILLVKFWNCAQPPPRVRTAAPSLEFVEY